MRALRKVEIVPVFVDIIPDVLDENKIYISEKYSIAMHNCLCGCGELVAMPLDEGMWSLIKDNDKVSFTPSVGCFSFPCKSHYIITKNVANFV